MINASWPRVMLMYTSASSSASSKAPCSVRPELSTPSRSHNASRPLRLPGNISLAITRLSITEPITVLSGGRPKRSSSLLRKLMSKGALWMINSASRK
ncbi:hypothetical protein D3C72_2300360 [compost metagenome]